MRISEWSATNSVIEIKNMSPTSITFPRWNEAFTRGVRVQCAQAFALGAAFLVNVLAHGALRRGLRDAGGGPRFQAEPLRCCGASLGAGQSPKHAHHAPWVSGHAPAPIQQTRSALLVHYHRPPKAALRRVREPRAQYLRDCAWVNVWDEVGCWAPDATVHGSMSWMT